MDTDVCIHCTFPDIGIFHGDAFITGQGGIFILSGSSKDYGHIDVEYEETRKSATEDKYILER